MESSKDFAKRLESQSSGIIEDPEQYARFVAPMLMFLSVRWDLHSEEERRQMVEKMVAELPAELLLHTLAVVQTFEQQRGSR